MRQKVGVVEIGRANVMCVMLTQKVGVVAICRANGMCVRGWVLYCRNL